MFFWDPTSKIQDGRQLNMQIMQICYIFSLFADDIIPQVWSP